MEETLLQGDDTVNRWPSDMRTLFTSLHSFIFKRGFSKGLGSSHAAQGRILDSAMETPPTQK